MEEALVGLFILAAIGWGWRESLRAKESAVDACRHFCRSHDLQLLDDTVSLSRFELMRSNRRLFGIRRVYEFEFSPNGAERRIGSVTITEYGVESVYLPLFDDPQ